MNSGCLLQFCLFNYAIAEDSFVHLIGKLLEYMMIGANYFGVDEGTIHFRLNSKKMELSDVWDLHNWKKQFKRWVGKESVVWFVDDELQNRKWFAERHSPHFTIVTFSNIKSVLKAIDMGTPCDIVVTDIFFPSSPIVSDQQASIQQSIYSQIDEAKVSELAGIWNRERRKWHLDGFEIARIVAKEAEKRKERIPVLLFSRKSTLLLGIDDWLGEPPAAVGNTFWLMEKIDPSIEGEKARKAASIQRDRILSALQYRNAVTPLWRKILGHLSIGCGPISFALKSDNSRRSLYSIMIIISITLQW